MIFVITGTNGPPFDRLMRAVEHLDTTESIIVQSGPSRIRPGNATCVDYFSLPGTEEKIRAARIVVTHGGVGSILVSLRNGKQPLVVPRLARFGEVADDHQLDLARRLESEGLVTFVQDLSALALAIEVQPSLAPSFSAPGGNPLVSDLRLYLRAVVRPGSRI